MRTSYRRKRGAKPRTKKSLSTKILDKEIKRVIDKNTQISLWQYDNTGGTAVAVPGAAGVGNRAVYFFTPDWFSDGYIDMLSNGLVQMPLQGTRAYVKKHIIEGYFYTAQACGNQATGIQPNFYQTNAIIRFIVGIDEQPTNANYLYDFYATTSPQVNVLQTGQVYSPTANIVHNRRFSILKDKIMHFQNFTKALHHFRIVVNRKYVMDFQPDSSVQVNNNAIPINKSPWLMILADQDTSNNQLSVAYTVTTEFEQHL